METIQGEIKSLAFGGMGVLRHDNFVVFVPFTAPGDIIICKIIQKKKNFAFGEVVEYLKFSSERTQPLCPYFGTCGGCQLQHIKYDAQIEYKKQAVKDALQRIANIKDLSIETLPAVQQWQYRRHITLQIKTFEGKSSIGYSAIDHTLLPVKYCPIFNSKEDLIIDQVRQYVDSLEPLEGRISFYKKTDQYVLFFQLTNELKNPADIKTILDKNARISGLVISSPSSIVSYGNCQMNCVVDELNISFSPHAFVQNHPEQSLNIYHKIVQIAKAANCSTAWDLYSGIGITSLLLARLGINVYAVEGNPWAVDLAKKNALENKCAGINFIKNDVQKSLDHLPSPDLILANPPRTGLTNKILETFINVSPQHIIYISCMPSTLARDLKLLYASNYYIQNCFVADMFPQTGHVETIIHLKKNAK